MEMSMTKLSGGGLTSNKLVQTKSYKAEPTNYKIDKQVVSTIGSAINFHQGPLQQPGAYSNPIGPSPSVAGPGGGRTVMRSGTQGVHGASVSGVARPGKGEPFRF
jgi:hypothetical protein